VTSETDPEPHESDDWTPRPVVFPIVAIPRRLAVVVGRSLVGAAGVALIAALMRALLYRQPSPSDLGLLGNGGGVVGFTNVFGQPSSGFADRMALFTSSGANLAIAVLLIVALVVIAMTTDASEADGWLTAWQRFVLSTTGVIASVVVVANLVMCFEILDNAPGLLIADDASNKASSIVGLLAPIVLSAAVAVYAGARLRSSGLSDSEPESDDI